ncbi:MAG: LytTR family transcriptional regulator DNA-binding domain-containing protein [Prevotella sp.]|nr:LytTR family transcriptional regulator DNA-binding domain-containing protein [Prevotella sp.]
MEGKVKRITFNSRDELLRMEIDKIVYFEANGNYTYVVTKNKLKGMIGMSLAKTELALTQQLGIEARRFMRVGKRFIVNFEHVYSINPGKQRLVLSDLENFSFQLPLSKGALRQMKELLTKNK